MRSRKKMQKNRSRNLFSRTASKVHNKNGRSRPMRGGYRL